MKKKDRKYYYVIPKQKNRVPMPVGEYIDICIDTNIDT